MMTALKKAEDNICYRDLWNEAVLRERSTQMLSLSAGVLKHKSFLFSTTDISSHDTESFTFSDFSSQCSKEMQNL